MAFLFAYPGFPQPARRPASADTPFPRWERRIAEVEQVVAWGRADERSPEDHGGDA